MNSSVSESNLPPSPSRPKVFTFTFAIPTPQDAMILVSVLALSAFAHWAVREILSDAYPFHQDTIRQVASASRGAFLFVCLVYWQALSDYVAHFLSDEEDEEMEDAACDCDACSPPSREST